MEWRDIRMNKVAQHVFMRQELEFQERLDGGKERFQQLVHEANRQVNPDSTSPWRPQLVRRMQYAFGPEASSSGQGFTYFYSRSSAGCLV